MALEKMDARGISRTSTETLYWPIVSDEDFSQANVFLAFLDSSRHPIAGDWVPATVEPNPDDAEQQTISLLIGPAGEDLTPADDQMQVYHVWVRIDDTVDTTQDYVRQAGRLTVR